MSAPGWVQRTRPMPDASACSASRPSAIWPVAATVEPPVPGAASSATVPGADTVTGPGAVACGLAEVLPFGSLPCDMAPAVAAPGVLLAEGLAPCVFVAGTVAPADVAAGTVPSVALPAGVPDDAAPAFARDGIAHIAIRA